MKNQQIIINFCPTGMIPTKEMTQYVPISPSEIIEQVHEAYDIGITIAHLHARLEDGTPTYKKNVYREIFEGVRKHCPDLIICASTSGRNFQEFEKRSEVIELKPDMCSLTLSSLNFLNEASINAPETIQRLASKMEEYGVKAELECFDIGMINYGKYLISKGMITGPFYWNLLFGNIAGFQANIHHIGSALMEIPKGHHVGFAGLGKDQLTMNSMAIAMGYGVRVGLEDNIWWDRERVKKCTNIDLVKRIHQLITINQKEFFTPKKFGKLGFRNNESKK